MTQNFAEFIAETKMWIFSLEAELSMGSMSFLKGEVLNKYMHRLAGLYNDADVMYGYNLDEVVAGFPRVYKLYNTVEFV